MPIKYTEQHTCEKCGCNFEWNYFEYAKQKLGSPIFHVETIPDNSARISGKNPNGGYNVEANCPHCGYDNRFIFNE